MPGEPGAIVTTEKEATVKVRNDVDVVVARQEGRRMAGGLGFGPGDVTLIATAISEVARNIVNYAGEGEIILAVIHDNGRTGVSVIARDKGPGIPDVALAMQDGYSTSKGLGLGLPGAKRIMDEFEISSVVGKGTTVKMRKWKR